MKRTIILASISVLCLLQTGWGQVPRTISYQGVLKDAGGSVLSGSYAIKFNLYDSQYAATPFWAETLPVTVTDGVFSEILGSDTLFNPLPEPFPSAVWLGIKIGTDEELPQRTELTSVPYSLKAGHAETATTAISAWSLTGNSGTDGGASNFLGTTDDKPLELHVNNARALRLEYTIESPNVIGGYSGNSVPVGVFGATIGGGGESGSTNRVLDQFGTVAGGKDNQAGDGVSPNDQTYATVGGGINNTASGAYATVPGGYANQATGNNSFAAGHRAKATHNGSFVWADQTVADFASTADNQFAVRATGGFRFLTSTDGSGLRLEPNATSPNVIAGYSGNEVSLSGIYGATVGGGGYVSGINKVTDHYCTVGGGRGNQAGNNDGTTGNALNNTVSGGDGNVASAASATVGGGEINTASGSYSTIGGGNDNAASSSSTTVSGGRSNTASAYAATVGGGEVNIASGDYATVSGGGFNNARGLYSVVSGGGGASAPDSNSALGDYSAVSGGQRNTASGDWATVDGGSSNTASSVSSTVGGGSGNTASGNYTTVPGGYSNVADGLYSFAAGRQAQANHDGCFVWADSYASNFTSTDADRFMVRASGGVYLYTNTGLTSGSYLEAGGTSWYSLSDRNMKENFVDEDGEAVLAAIAGMPIPSWNYKSQDPAIRHIGPMAQDFYAAFGLGEDERYINTLDIDGINLLAIQALEKRTEELKGALQKLDEQAREIEVLQAAVTSLEDLVKVAVGE